MFRRVLQQQQQQVARQQQWRRHASVLVVADHNNKKLSAATLSTVTAGSKLGDVVVLVAGKAANAVGAAAAKVKGVKKVLHADDAQYEHALPENLAPLVSNPAISIYMYFSFVVFQKKKDCFFA
jgi:electron transfer flavoprotein alpha subunit